MHSKSGDFEQQRELSMATSAEKSAIEKNYYPTGIAKVLPEILNELLMLVKLELAASKLNFISIPAICDVAHKPEYLVAFNPGRLRR